MSLVFFKNIFKNLWIKTFTTNTTHTNGILTTNKVSNYDTLLKNTKEYNKQNDKDMNDTFTNIESNCNIEEIDSKKKFEDKYYGFIDARVLSDIILGLSDGLIVPFALTAGLSSLGQSKIVITGGLAELISGAMSMGLGGYLAAKSESEYYKSQLKNEKMFFFKKPEQINQQVADILFDFGLSEKTILMFLNDLEHKSESLINFLLKVGKRLDEPPHGREITSALTIGLSYFVGGFIPLIPYFFFNLLINGLIVSVCTMITTLFIFGYIKAVISLGKSCKLKKKLLEGLHISAVGSISAGSAFFVVYLIDKCFNK